jgi:hypothetical protein
LPNGLAFDRPLPQVLEAQQHGEHPFELRSRWTSYRPSCSSFFPGFEPRQYLAFEEAALAGDIGGDEIPVSLQFVRVAGQFVERTSAWATAAATANRGYPRSMTRDAFVHRSLR